MAKRITNSTPKKDGFRMPGEFEPQDHVFMIWPECPDNWRNGAKPAQKVFTNVAMAIAKHTKVTVLVNNTQYANARARLPEYIRVVEASSDDSWVRDCGPTFVINDKNPLINKLSSMEPETAALATAQIYDLAEMANRPLSPERMTAFMQRSRKLLDMIK